MQAYPEVDRFIQQLDIPLSLADARQEECPLISVNAGFERLTGYAANSIQGRNCRFLQGDLDQPEARSEVREIIANNRDGHVMLRNFRKNGEAFDNLLFLAPIFEGGETLYLLGAQFDVPKQNATEAAQSHNSYLRAHLERLNDESRYIQAETRRATAGSIAMSVQTLLQRRAADNR